ncbi:MAG: MarR family winged helix-turn-helix transcriptional regulator [Burkholderiaceae bacterium]
METEQDRLNKDLWLFHIAFRQLVKVPDAILRGRGLGRVHDRILFVIGRSGEISVGDIAERLEITRQAIHGPMKQLRDLEMIASRASEANRTVQLVRLTEAGKQFDDEIHEVQRRHMRQAFETTGRPGAEGWREVMLKVGLTPPPGEPPV